MTLYSRNKKGKALVWSAESTFELNENGYIPIIVSYGQLDGKIQSKTRYTKSGKNLGKKNATTIQEQAKLDIDYLYKAQRDKDYFDSLEDYIPNTKAMLASVIQDHWKKLKLTEDNDTFVKPYYVQPKLNGIRCLIKRVDEDTLEFMSRENLPITPLKGIVKDLLSILPIGARVDGELYKHGLDFEHIASIVNSESNRFITCEKTGAQLWNENDVQIHIYDYLADGTSHEKDYSERKADLDSVFKDSEFNNVVIVETKTILSLSELESYYGYCMLLAYEGCMVRDPSGVYEYGYRSLYLYKYKKMLEAEFKVLNIIDSENDPGQPVFIVSVSEDITCNVRKEGSKELNTSYLLNKDSYIGKWLTIQYQTYTKYGNLSFPIGLSFREGKEDEDGNFIPTI